MSNGYNPYGDLNQPVAADRPGAGRRLAGLIIDGVIIGIISGAIISLTGIDNTLVSSLVSIIVWLIARIGSEVAWGATPGKRILGMKVVTTDGSNPDVAASFKRNCWYIPMIIPIAGPLVTLVLEIVIGVGIAKDPEKRSWFDKLADVSVVRV